jgi:hypothetical protein
MYLAPGIVLLIIVSRINEGYKVKYLSVFIGVHAVTLQQGTHAPKSRLLADRPRMPPILRITQYE